MKACSVDHEAEIAATQPPAVVDTVHSIGSVLLTGDPSRCACSRRENDRGYLMTPEQPGGSEAVMDTFRQRLAYTLRNLRVRFWLASLLSVSSVFLGGLTAVSPSWIEAWFGVDPDRGSGALEWALVVLLLLAVAALRLARSEWRRARLRYRAMWAAPGRAD